MVYGDVFRMSEAADAAESAAARVARKQTNKGRAAEELNKSAATLTLPSKMLPTLRLLNKKCWLLLRRSLPSQPDKWPCCRGACQDRCCRCSATCCRCCIWGWQGGCRLCKSQRRLMVTWIKCMVVGRMVLFKVRVCLLSCAEEVCFKNVNAAQHQNQD